MGQAMTLARIQLEDGRSGLFWLTPDQVTQGLQQNETLSLNDLYPNDWVEAAQEGRDFPKGEIIIGPYGRPLHI